MLLFPLLLLPACLHHKITPKVSLKPLTATPKTIDSLWNVGLDNYRRHKWDKAATAFDRAELELPPGDHRILQGRLYLGELYVRSGSNLQGVREYRRLVDEFPTDSLAPEALLAAADAYFKLWRSPDLDADVRPHRAIGVQRSAHPLSQRAGGQEGARATGRARQSLRASRNTGTPGIISRCGRYDSAILYYKSLVADHQHATIVPKALADLITAYRKLGYTEDIHDTCDVHAEGLVGDARVSRVVCSGSAAAAPKPVAPASGAEKPAGG